MFFNSAQHLSESARVALCSSCWHHLHYLVYHRWYINMLQKLSQERLSCVVEFYQTLSSLLSILWILVKDSIFWIEDVSIKKLWSWIKEVPISTQTTRYIWGEMFVDVLVQCRWRKETRNSESAMKRSNWFENYSKLVMQTPLLSVICIST